MLLLLSLSELLDPLELEPELDELLDPLCLDSSACTDTEEGLTLLFFIGEAGLTGEGSCLTGDGDATFFGVRAFGVSFAGDFWSDLKTCADFYSAGSTLLFTGVATGDGAIGATFLGDSSTCGCFSSSMPLSEPDSSSGSPIAWFFTIYRFNDA